MSRVLIVDDDPVIRRLLQVNFRLEGFDVDTAGGGVEAIEIMTATRPDVVVLDLTMPEVDGFDVVRSMRSDGDLRPIPVVILSARSRDEDREEATRLGAAGFVTKPFDPADLVALVRGAISPAEESA